MSGQHKEPEGKHSQLARPSWQPPFGPTLVKKYQGKPWV